jgi:ATP-dependent Clp protease protease subunit
MATQGVLAAQSQQPYLLFTPQVVTAEATTALIDQVRSLVEQGVTTLTLLMSSPGGNVYAGLLAYNFLRGCPLRLTTHNIGICDSISAVIYAAGTRRLSVPHGRFLLHGVNSQFAANASLSEGQLEERLTTMRNDTDNIAGVLAGATGKQEEDVHRDMRRGLTLDPQLAIDYGLVHEIAQALYPEGARLIRVA